MTAPADAKRCKAPGMTGAQAKRFVYRILAKTLVVDLANNSEWMREGLGEFDQRRIRNAINKVIDELKRKADRP